MTDYKLKHKHIVYTFIYFLFLRSTSHSKFTWRRLRLPPQNIPAVENTLSTGVDVIGIVIWSIATGAKIE